MLALAPLLLWGIFLILLALPGMIVFRCFLRKPRP